MTTLNPGNAETHTFAHRKVKRFTLSGIPGMSLFYDVCEGSQEEWAPGHPQVFARERAFSGTHGNARMSFPSMFSKFKK